MASQSPNPNQRRPAGGQPGQIRPGVTHAVISQADLLASFASMLGVEIPACDSENMFDALVGKDGFGRDFLYAESPAGGRVLREGKWLSIEPSDESPFDIMTQTETAASRDPQLYNLDYDIGEVKNLADRHPDIIEKMAAKMDSITNRKF